MLKNNKSNIVDHGVFNQSIKKKKSFILIIFRYINYKMKDFDKIGPVRVEFESQN